MNLGILHLVRTGNTNMALLQLELQLDRSTLAVWEARKDASQEERELADDLLRRTAAYRAAYAGEIERLGPFPTPPVTPGVPREYREEIEELERNRASLTQSVDHILEYYLPDDGGGIEVSLPISKRGDKTQGTFRSDFQGQTEKIENRLTLPAAGETAIGALKNQETGR